jgi:hypothetical protein
METRKDFEYKVCILTEEIEALEKLRYDVHKRLLDQVGKVSQKIEEKRRKKALLENEWCENLLSAVEDCDTKKY